MSFLAPWAFGLAALAALPVVLHLFRRDTRRRLAFPAIRYLRQARDRSARALKIRDRLLLVARVGLVIVLAVAAAAPLAGRGEASDHEPSDVVLLIDNSGSMNRIAGDATLLDRQRGRARSILQHAGPSDRFWIVPAVGPAVTRADAAEATIALDQVDETDAAADLGAAVREAVRLLPARDGRYREIVLLSDFQRSAVPRPTFVVPDDIGFLISRIEAGVSNDAVVGVTAEPSGPGGDGAVVASLWTSERETVGDTVEVRLVVDGETASIARASRGGSVVFRLPDIGPGEHAISVEIPPSGLRADDRRMLVLRPGEPPAVVHSGPVDSSVGHALATLEEAGRVSLLPDPGEHAAAVLIEGVPATEPDEVVAPGTVWILVPPTDDALLARFNSMLGSLGVPWRVEVVEAPGDLSLVSSPDVPGLERIRNRGHHALVSMGASASDVLLETTAGAPWVVRGSAASHPYLLIGSPLDPDHSTLPVDAAMLPFMEALLFRWTGLGGVVSSPVMAGESAILPEGAVSVASPGGQVTRVDGGSPYAPLKAGVHAVLLSAGETALLAAVVPPSESDLAEASGDSFGGGLGAPDAVVAGTDTEWLASIYGRRRGARVAPYLIALALLLVLEEMVLATPGESRPRRAVAHGDGSRQ
jgi:hypothetical protein